MYTRTQCQLCQHFLVRAAPDVNTFHSRFVFQRVFHAV
jgi:hypothetical protein